MALQYRGCADLDRRQGVSCLSPASTRIGILVWTYTGYRQGLSASEWRMFTHIMIGSDDLDRAKVFYDATFIALGGPARRTNEAG